MRIYRGWVVDNFDVKRSGVLDVYCPEVEPFKTFPVTYTTPYAVAAEGGMVAIPGKNTEIFIFKPDGESDESNWYYMNSVFRKYKPEIPVLPEISPGENVYNSNKLRPEAITIKDPKGNQFSLFAHTSKEQYMMRAELKTAGDKMFQMVDSLKNDKIVIRNQHGDRFLLAGDGFAQRPERSAQIRTWGHQDYESTHAGVHTLASGGEVDIVNDTSVAAKSDNEEYGNINADSKYRDINLIAREGRLFINTPDADEGFVQIASGKSITIYSDDSINVRSGGDLNILSSEGSIHMKAEKRITLNAGGNVEIDGSQVHLAPPGGTQDIQIEKETNHYGD